MGPSRWLDPNGSIQGTNQGKRLNWIDESGANCLAHEKKDYLRRRHPSQLYWHMWLWQQSCSRPCSMADWAWRSRDTISDALFFFEWNLCQGGGLRGVGDEIWCIIMGSLRMQVRTMVALVNCVAFLWLNHSNLETRVSKNCSKGEENGNDEIKWWKKVHKWEYKNPIRWADLWTWWAQPLTKLLYK